MPDEGRPDPDALLAQVRGEGAGGARGRLKVFFGATAGVGKTYAMLEEARARKRDGVDVVVGVVETHRRWETERLLEGIEVLPRKAVQYRRVTLGEFDLDRALERRPELILMDELAHTNAPGSRHAKRWQDVEELLAAGIDVYTTVNVQHVESLNDVVAQITHVKVRETVPDAVLERADEIELIDIPPEELLKRLEEGKVYIPEQAKRALQNFFRPGNLIALRQLALRHTAQRVDAQMQVYRRAHAVAETWPIAERVLVGIGPAPSSERLVRATKRMADRLGAEWIAIFVETPASANWPEVDRRRAWETLALAETLGATTATLSGSGTAAEILAYARAHNVTKLVVGKPTHPRWRDVVFGSMVDAIVRGSGDIDVYVITGEPEEMEPGRRRGRRGGPAPGRARDYLWAAGGVAAATVAAVAVRPHFDPGNLIMIYLLTVVLVAMRFGRGASILASVLGVAAFDFFCVPPYLTFAVADTQYLIAFAAMLVVAVVISALTARARDQARISRRREQRTAALLEMSRDLVNATEPDDILRIGARHLRDVFDADVAVLLPDQAGRLTPWSDTAAATIPADAERAVAQWVFDHARPAGAGTDTLPSATMLYLPLRGARATVGSVGVRPRDSSRFADPEQLHFLETFAAQMAASLESAHLAEEALRVQEMREMDRMQSEFVAVASHELRAPIAALAARLEDLKGHGDRAGAGAREGRLLEGATEEVARLRSLVDELLDLSRLEAGRLELARRAVAPGRLVERALATFRSAAQQAGVDLGAELPADVPAIEADPERAETILENLLSNAIRFAGSGGHVLVSADAVGPFVQFSVADDGAGIPIEQQARIFDRFVRVRRADGSEGSGLGLAIAREIVRAHGGAIWVDSGPGPGSVFSFTLPVAETAPNGSRQA